jgi:hypothetical protein
MVLDHKLIIDRTIEQLRDYDFNKLSEFINYIANKNPYNSHGDKLKYSLWQEQSYINFPILYLASIYLYIHAKNKGCTTLLFASRDCSLFYKVFKSMFPHVNSHYFNCSRNMFEIAITRTHKPFKKYIESIVDDIDKTMFIDIHGTGQRMISYFNKEFEKVPHCFLVSARFSSYEKFPKMIQKYIDKGRLVALVFNAHGSPIEMLNYDTIGTLQGYDEEEGAIRDELEYDIELVKPYHECIEYATNHMKSLNYHDITNKYRLETLQKLIKKLFKDILSDLPAIAKHISHVGRHAKENTHIPLTFTKSKSNKDGKNDKTLTIIRRTNK